MKIFRTVLLAVGVAGALLLAPSIHATTMVPVNLAQIVEQTEKAFVGTVTGVETVQVEKGWADKITVKVSDPVLGPVSAGDEVSWLQFRIAEEVRLPGMPQYKVGGEHLIFLSRKGEGTDFQAPYAMGQGSFQVFREGGTDPIVRNQFLNAHLFTGLDTEKIATAAVERAPSTKALAGAEKSRAVAAKRATFGQTGPGATSLSGIKEAAQTLAAAKQPSKSFAADTAGKSDSGLSIVLKAH